MELITQRQPVQTLLSRIQRYRQRSLTIQKVLLEDPQSWSEV